MVAGTNPLRVLVVDDERPIADSLAMILRMAGYEVQAAYSAEEAVQLLVVFVPDVLITDIIMGAMNGIRLGIYVTDQVPHCTVILLSGQAETASVPDRNDARRLTIRLFTKPLHPQVLLDLLAREAMSREKELEKLPPSGDSGPLRIQKVAPIRARPKA